MFRFSAEVRTRFSAEHAEMMDAIERHGSSWESRFAQYVTDTATAVAEARGYERTTARLLITVQAANLARRIVALTEGFITLTNADNGLAAPAVVRALYEAACVPCYMADQVLPRLKKGRVNDVQRLLWRLGMGTNPAAGYGHIRPVTIEALNRAAGRCLMRHLGEQSEGRMTAEDITDMMYGPLSEQTHPNFTGNAIGTTVGSDGTPTYTLRPGFDQCTFDHLLSSAHMIHMTAQDALDEVLAAAAASPLPMPLGEPHWQEGDLHPSTTASEPS